MFDLRENAEAYRTVFSALGYTLSDHPRGFYYFMEGQQSRTDVLSRLVYFFTCLFSDLDQGRFEPVVTRWVDTLTDHDFQIGVLIDRMFAASDRQRVFAQLQVRPDNFDKVIIAQLCRCGIAFRPQAGSVRFRQSVYRFVDFFQVCADENAVRLAQNATSEAQADAETELDDEDGEMES